MLLGTLLWAVVIIQGVAILALTKQLFEVRGLIVKHARGAVSLLSLGSPAPQFAAPELESGRSFSSTEFRGEATILLFLTPHCSYCRKIALEIQHAETSRLRNLVIYCDGTNQGCLNSFAGLVGKIPLLVKGEDELTQLYQISGLPAGVCIDERGRTSDMFFAFEINDILDRIVERPLTDGNAGVVELPV